MIRRLALAAVIFFAFAAATPAADPVDYLRDVKPTLTVRCYACHGALQQKSGMRADTAKSLIEHGAVIPGNSADSPLVKHVSGAKGFKPMPPPGEGEVVTPEQLKLIRAWIDAGAKAPPNELPDPDPREHWSFRTPVRPKVPGPGNPIDAFLRADWAKHNLTPAGPAEKRLLLRRVTLDLTGLPPTPEEADAFLKDASPDAYEKVVDRLLASPAYGERWGRHFLDIWRFSDWWGLGPEVRNSQKHMWRWRDWAVESFNADVGYDRMIREMLAADELHPTDPDKLRATGYLARQYFIFNRTTWLDETVEHTAKAFLGLTFNCAKCHDHKYDPLAQNDYYRFRAIFEPYQVRMDLVPGEADFEKDGLPRAFDCNAEAPTYKHERGDDRRPLTNRVMPPGVPPLLAIGEFRPLPVTLPAEAHTPQVKPEVVATLLDAAKREGPLAVAAIEARAAADELRVTGPTTQYQEAARAAAAAEAKLVLAKAEPTAVKAEFAAFFSNAKARPEAVKKRDAARTALATARKAAASPGEKYTPLRGSLKTRESNLETEESRAKPFPTTSTGRRTALANWIADPRNPLTARVAVNHVWMRHFGAPLVPTVFDFGRKGTRPLHPELLDFLACEFMERGWSFKHLHRLIVTSQAYRMSSSAADRGANAKLDPENRHLSRQNPVRMEAQVVRDSLLHLAGQLDHKLGGPSVPAAEQDASRRRSLYFFQSHNEHHKFLSQFDDANVLECYRRTESIVPAQALTLSNSKFALTMADAIAKRIAPKDDDAFVTATFEAILGTSPSAEERTACTDALTEWKQQLKAQKHVDPTTKARTNLVAALLNHNDFVTVR